MKKGKFEWDESKNIENQEKHGFSFELAQYAFADPYRLQKTLPTARQKKPPCKFSAQSLKVNNKVVIPGK